MHRVLLYWVLLALLAGCASTHNLRNDGHSLFGGGFAEEELAPGLYEMSARGNVAPWPSFSAARATWQMRAEKLCGASDYIELEVTENSGGGFTTDVYVARVGLVAVPRYNAVKYGYVLCKSAAMNTEAARQFLDRRFARTRAEMVALKRRELEALGGADCATPPDDAERKVKRGKALLALGEHAAAHACFTRAQEGQADPRYAKEACFQLGLMYETGLGVAKDLGAAKSWYAKAGL